MGKMPSYEIELIGGPCDGLIILSNDEKIDRLSFPQTNSATSYYAIYTSRIKNVPTGKLYFRGHTRQEGCNAD